jgi:hypothetical protein
MLSLVTAMSVSDDVSAEAQRAKAEGLFDK